jgi:hypothetical protein
MTSIFRGQRPDLTPAQSVGILLAGIPVLANLLRAFGLFDASPEQEQALGDAMSWGGVVAGLLFASDAGLRAARNAADSRRDAAALSAPTAPHDPPAALEFDEEPIDDASATPLGGGNSRPETSQPVP